MSYEKVVAVYDTDANAEAAVESLKSAGYLGDDISVIRNEGEAERAGLQEPAIWQHLFGRDVEHSEAAAFAESFEDGHVVVSVRVPDSEAPNVVRLLDSQEPVEVLGRSRSLSLVETTARGGEERLRLAEEQLDVGTRVVESGRTRVRRFVVEKPVEANITLHEEHAEVMRRAISDRAYAREIDWSDKTIEVTETAEEPVVGKTAHLTEEVVIRRQGVDRVQTVHDTVRCQQIAIERVPIPAETKKSA
jgi:uncharacterized protein (TIGR02271 family)